MDDSSAAAMHALGQFYASQQRWPEAVTQLNRSMLSAPTEKKYRYDLAVALVHTGDVNTALSHFLRTVGDAEAHYNVGLILHEEGKLREAEAQMLRAVTKKPELHEAQYWLDEIRREQETVLASHTTSVESAPRVSPLGAPQPAATPGGHSAQHQQLQNQRAVQW